MKETSYHVPTDRHPPYRVGERPRPPRTHVFKHPVVLKPELTAYAKKLLAAADK